MKEVLRTSDAVEISWAEAILRAAGIECVVFDQHMSILEGSIGALPRRVMVADEDLFLARRVLEGARPEAGGPAGTE